MRRLPCELRPILKRRACNGVHAVKDNPVFFTTLYNTKVMTKVYPWPLVIKLIFPHRKLFLFVRE